MLLHYLEVVYVIGCIAFGHIFYSTNFTKSWDLEPFARVFLTLVWPGVALMYVMLLSIAAIDFLFEKVFTIPARLVKRSKG